MLGLTAVTGCSCPSGPPAEAPSAAASAAPQVAPAVLVQEASVVVPVLENTAFGCAPLEGHLHVLFADAAQERSTHAVFDPAGRPVRPPVEVPLLVWGVVPCGEDLLASVSKPGDNRPRVARITAGGAAAWQAEVPAPEGLTTWPVPLCEGGRGLLVWRSGAEDGVLSWAGVAGDRLGPVSSAPLPERTWELSVAPAPGGFAALRTDPKALELLRVTGDKVERAFLETQDLTGFSVAASGGRLAVWTLGADSGARVRWYGERLAPEGPPIALAGAPEGAQSIRVTPADEGTWIVRASGVVRTGRTAQVPGDRHEPVMEAREYIGVYSMGQARMADWAPVASPGGADCGAWIGGRFALLSGKGEVTLTTYRVSRP